MSPAAWGTALALAALMGVLASTGGGTRPGFSPAPWIPALVAVLVAANIVFSFQILASTRAAATWLAYAFVFEHCRRLAREGGDGDGRRAPTARAVIVGAVVLAGSALAAHGLYQSLHGFERLAGSAGPDLSEALRARVASGRAVATLGLPGALAGFLALCLPLTVGLAMCRRRARSWRAAAWGLAAVQAAGLVATRSAAGLLAVAGAGALVAWWGRRGSPGAARRAIPLVLAGAGLAGAIALMALRAGGDRAADEGAGPLALRLGNWQVAARLFLEHPVLGTGAGCYGIAFPQHRTWEMNESRYAHNSYLQLFSEGGIVLGAAGAVLAAALWLALRRRMADDAGRRDRFLAAACLSFLLHNLADFTFYLPAVGFAFFALAGLACGGAAGGAGARGGGRAFRMAAALALAAFALLVTRADLVKEVARKLVKEDEILAAAVASDAVIANPIDADARSLLSHLLMERGLRSGNGPDLEEAEAEAARAVELDPRTPHHWHHLGRVRLARQDPLGALAALTQASRLYPIRIEYRQDRDAVAALLASRGENP